MIDDAVLADGLTHTLSDSGYLVTPATTGAYAKQLLLAQDFDLIVLDWGCRIMDGLEHCKVDSPPSNLPQLRQAGYRRCTTVGERCLREKPLMQMSLCITLVY